MARATKKRSTDELISDLGTDDSKTRRKAIKALGKRGEEHSLGYLIPALQDPDEEVRLAVIKALVHFGAAALSPLSEALENAAVAVRQQAALSLGKLGHPSALPPLAKALQDPDMLVRGFAAYALSDIGEQSITPTLIAALDDPEFIVRRYVVDALGVLGDPRAVHPLAGILMDADTNTRLNAIDALARIGVPAREPLIAALRHPDAPVRQHAALAIGNLGLHSALPLLLACLKDDQEPLVRSFVAHSLGRLRAQDTTPEILHALLRATHDPDPVVRRYAVDALGTQPDPAALPRLIALLRDDVNDWVRQRAAAALRGYPQPQAQKALQQAGQT